jgi:transcriptional regulator with XRE-family HTH domain
MVAAAQIRAARGLLKISAAELAALANVTLRTVQRMENAEGVPPSRSGTLARIQIAFEQQGVEFIGDPLISPGVRLRRDKGAT